MHNWIGQDDEVDDYGSQLTDCIKRGFYVNMGFWDQSAETVYISRYEEQSEAVSEWRDLCPDYGNNIQSEPSNDNMTLIIGSVVGGIFALVILLACYLMAKRMTKKTEKRAESRIQNLEHELQVRTNALRYVVFIVVLSRLGFIVALFLSLSLTLSLTHSHTLTQNS